MKETTRITPQKNILYTGFTFMQFLHNSSKLLSWWKKKKKVHQVFFYFQKYAVGKFDKVNTWSKISLLTTVSFIQDSTEKVVF